MLNPQTAQERLKFVYDGNWMSRRARAARRLGGALSGIAYAILQCDRRGEPLQRVCSHSGVFPHGGSR